MRLALLSVFIAPFLFAACDATQDGPQDSHAAVDASVDDASAVGADGPDTPGPGEAGPYDEIAAAYTRFLGAATPTGETTTDGVTRYDFDMADGPQCIRATPYRVFHRDGPRDDLVVFLQGGGACWSAFCFAIETAPEQMPIVDVLNADKPSNPFREHDVAYLPYCDGSLFAGDASHDDDGDGTADRVHAGLVNLTAALEVTRERYPSPTSISLVGASGGGYGTIIATPMIRLMWPDVPLTVVNDSGVGIADGDDPGFVEQLMEEFDAEPLLPFDSCPDCIANGHLTRFIQWQLDQDPELRIAAISSHADQVIANIFLGLDAEVFTASLLAETGALHDLHPERYNTFLYRGDTHTALLGDVQGVIGELPDDAPDFGAIIRIGSIDEVVVDGVSVAQWLTWLVEGDAAWGQLVEPPE